MVLTRPALFLLLPVVAVASGCSQRPAAEAAAPAGREAAVIELPSTTESPESTETITGTVAETMDAGAYTYVRLTTPDGDVWAASSKFPVKVGDRVVVPLEMPMKDFHSDTLKRDFPLIYFATAITPEGQAAQGQQTMPPGHPPVGSSKSAASPVTERILPPAGGHSIADLWASRQSLAGKTITVRGKVMKFNGGIMGKNWVHLQDGTGKADDGTNDVTLTTADEVQVGDVVTMTGTVALEKDFGAGYSYRLILEDAKVVK